MRYPKRIFLIRGKYDDKFNSFKYGFHDECLSKYGNSKVYNYLVDVFNYFPLCAKLENQIFCVNSGLSHEINTIDEINSLERIKDIPEEGPIVDLLYNEPGENYYGFIRTKGAEYLYGYEITKNFNEINKFKYMIIGAKLYSYEGYKWFQDNQLCSIFSASNFCNKYRNKGAVMMFDEYLENKILQFYYPNKEKYDNNKRILDYFFQ